MKNNLGGSSFLTSDIIILAYYACALAALFTGFLGVVALVGAIISRSLAVKENADLVAKHCSWITRSIWVNIGAIVVISIVVIAILGTGDTAALENYDYDSITSLEAMLDDPALGSVMYTITGGLAVALLVFAWYVYRMLRGIIALFCSRPPKA